MQKAIKKFTTVNNWVCKEFIHCLVMSKWRHCCFIIYNTFDLLDDDIACRMVGYFYEAVSYDTLVELYHTLPVSVRDSIYRKLFTLKGGVLND